MAGEPTRVKENKNNIYSLYDKMMLVFDSKGFATTSELNEDGNYHILYAPGYGDMGIGDIAAAESIVDYLHLIFGDDIRAIVPQMAMSAGTMIALSCPTIIMGKESNLCPVDPQFHG